MRSQHVILILCIIILTACIGCACRNVGVKVESYPTPEGVVDIPPSPPSYAPGTAHVSAECIDTIEHDNSYECTLKIITVFGYGSSTPAISKGREIQTSISKALLKNLKKDPASLFTAGNTMKMTIRSLKPRMAGATGPDWQTIAVE